MDRRQIRNTRNAERKKDRKKERKKEKKKKERKKGRKEGRKEGSEGTLSLRSSPAGNAHYGGPFKTGVRQSSTLNRSWVAFRQNEGDLPGSGFI